MDYKWLDMARNYIRPEISAGDLKAFQSARCVMINPSLEDVALALKQAEKGCRKNKLPLQEAREAWRAVVEGKVLIAGAGQGKCPARFKYGIQCTTIQVVRLSEGLTGLCCDRQQVEPGQSIQRPVPEFSKLSKMRKPKRWLNSILQTFWTHLTDEEIEGIEQDITLLVMEKAAARISRAIRLSRKGIKLRRSNIEALFRGKTPHFISEFHECCHRIASEMVQGGHEYIAWRDFKKQQPSLVARYQPELLSLVNNNRLGTKQLESVKLVSPYRVSFSFWDGSQRLFDRPQLVLAIRNPGIHMRFMEKAGEYKEVSSQLRVVAATPYHPGTEHTIGWLRVHVDDANKLCFVDEVQSDTLESARIMNEKAAKEFLRECAEWNIHGFATVCQWARDIGYRAAIHSRESAEKKPGMTPSDRKWNTYYQPIIKRFGLQEISLEEYPARIRVQQ
jgi:desulfoferrodoxin (superoxide reductase-like protein)